MKKMIVLVMIFGVLLSLPLFCGGGAEPTSLGPSKEIVVLMPSTTNNALAEWARWAEKEAEELGYDISIIENNFKQEEQDIQVQQQIASKDKPAAYVWWPADNKAGLASLRALAATGVPVFQANQLPISGYDDLWVAYAGCDDVLNGRVAGQMVVEAMNELKKIRKLSSKGGNCLVIRFPVGYSAGDDRLKGFNEAIQGSGIQVLDIQPAGFDETTGYNIGSQMITANRAKGIDIIYAENDALAFGFIQALDEAGYQPGKDIMVVGGTCHGNLKYLREGKQYSSGLQAIGYEGLLTIATVHRYLTNGNKIQGEVYRAPDDPDNLPDLSGPPAKYNFIPNPAVRSDEVDSTMLWGYPFSEICTY